jgi:hypothetical protein
LSKSITNNIKNGKKGTEKLSQNEMLKKGYLKNNDFIGIFELMR